MVTSPGQDVLHPTDGGSKSKTGMIAGIIVLVTFLAVSSIICLLFYLRRRKRGNDEPMTEKQNSETDGKSEARTTWHEMETNSNRSSDVSYGVDDIGMEMQPSSPFPGSGISMYDDNPMDETINPNPSFQDELNTENDNEDKHRSSLKKVNVESKNNLDSKKTKQSDEKSLVVFDKNLKSFKIQEGNPIEKQTEDASYADGADADSEDGNATDNGGMEKLRPETKGVDFKGQQKPSEKSTLNGYSLAKVIPEQGMQDEKTNTVNILYSEESENSDEENEDLEEDDVYVNVKIGKDKSKVDLNSEGLKPTGKEVSGKDVSVVEMGHETQQQKELIIESKTENNQGKRMSLKAPVPQPRSSLRNSNVKTDQSKLNNEVGRPTEVENKSQQETMKNHVDTYVEYDPVEFDPSDYDDVDQIYDIPKNNKLIDENEKLE